jgi:hypothetical protein
MAKAGGIDIDEEAVCDHLHAVPAAEEKHAWQGPFCSKMYDSRLKMFSIGSRAVVPLDHYDQ